MEQVPHIAMYCQEFKSRLFHVVPQYLLPMVVKFLTDDNNQVRKTSQVWPLIWSWLFTGSKFEFLQIFGSI